MIMKVIVVTSLVIFGWIGASQAAGSDACGKDCRDYQRVCLQAHSQAACKSEYNVCMKACAKK
jgi:hypothetical protein